MCMQMCEAADSLVRASRGSTHTAARQALAWCCRTRGAVWRQRSSHWRVRRSKRRKRRRRERGRGREEGWINKERMNEQEWKQWLNKTSGIIEGEIR